MTLRHGIEWILADEPVAYPDAIAWMEDRAAAIASGLACEAIWLIEHPALYTAGTSADPTELLDPRFPVFSSGRGGRYTYHGPGQRVVYLMLDLNKRGRDVRAFVHAIEKWMIATLARLGVVARREPGRIGIWTGEGPAEAKIGAIGVRIRKWVSLHGFSINIAPELGDFDGIVPCGLAQYKVTSLQSLDAVTTFAAFDAALMAELWQFLVSVEKPSQSA